MKKTYKFRSMLLACIAFSLISLHSFGTGTLNILIATNDYDTWVTDVQTKLIATGQFNSVTIFKTNLGTPTLATLQTYDAVLVWTNFQGHANSVLLGNTLAAYIDGGGAVVDAVFDNASLPIGGAYNTPTYRVLNPLGQIQGVVRTLGTVLLPAHAIMQGVTSFSGGIASYISTSSSLTPGSYSIALYDNNAQLIMAKENVGPAQARRVSLNFFPPSSTAQSNLWDASTDGALIMANALTWAVGSPCAPININFSVSGLKQPLWAPANDPYTFYYGLGDAKRINANVSGGVGPYTYTWSNSGAPALLPRSYYPANSIDLFRPLAATTVSVDVFDAGTGCTHTATVNIGWDGQYHCSAPNEPWNVVVCIGGQTSCVTWATAKAMLKANPPTATLGACANPPKTDLVNQASFSVYPNPSSGLFTLEMPIAANSKGSVEVMDVNGRALYSESLDVQEGVLYHTLDLGALPNGLYIVRVATDNEFATERIQIIR